MDSSPVWKKPSDVMKIHRRRKSLSQKKVTASQEQRTDFIYKSPSKSVKRRNPFTSTENVSNKRHMPSKEPTKTNEPMLFSILDSVEPSNEKKKHQEITSPDVLPKSDLESVLSADKPAVNKAQVTTQQQEIANKTEEPQISSHLPIDWCLKTKLRVVSSRPLSWCSQLKSAEEARGVSQCLREETSRVDNTATQKEEFQKNLMYWIHPNLPWVKLFPRIIDDTRTRKSSSFLLQDDVQGSLQAAWEESFTSVFHQFRSRLCPYFYLCTHQFTVLFCESSVTQSGIVAMVTPTTRGFRELLQNEGITFRLPVSGKQSNQLSTSTSPKDDTKTTAQDDNSSECAPPLPDPEEDENDEDDTFGTNEGASVWLESIGLDKKEFPSLDPRKVKLQREGFRLIDNRPESLVFVEGSDVQALFNFLLNCRTCTATSGAQAGVPPTILAPTGFKGSSLKCHKVKHTVVKQPDKDGSITHAHILEIAGPILPHHTQSLINLYHRTQQENFGMVFNNHDITAPFNILGRLHQENVDTDLANIDEIEQNCGDGDKVGQSSSNKHFRHKPISDKICAIKEIVCTPEGFTWNS